LSTTSRASRRAQYPAEVAVAQADAIAVAEVVSWDMADRNSGRAILRIDKVLRGEVPTGTLELSMDGDHRKVGDRLLVHLALRSGTWSGLRDGTAIHTDALEAERVAQIAVAADWSKEASGWKATIAVTPYKATVGDEIDAYVIYRNVSDELQSFSYREWPPESHCKWTLQVSRDGEPIGPKPHPHLTPEEIADYFSKHGHQFEIELKPGETFAFPLQRINSAEAGWGYKQRIGFQYWPLESAGTYSVGAVDSGFPGREALVIPVGSVTLEAN